MNIPTASDKKSVEIRLIVDNPEDAGPLLKVVKDIFKRITVINDDESRNIVPAQAYYGEDKQVYIHLPKYATLTIREADDIKKTSWGVNRVQMKEAGKSGSSVTFIFRKAVS